MTPTKIDQFYDAGVCERGNRCSFEHLDRNSTSSDKVGEMCQQWKHFAKCSNGDACRFIHQDM
jgi:hypothetical protein